MKTILSLFIYLTLLFLHLSCFSQSGPNIQWYFINNNKINHLIRDDLKSTPLLNKGTNYRIVKINAIQGNYIKSVSITAQKVKVDLYELPLIKDYNNNYILDLMIPSKPPLPFKQISTSKSSTRYFLVKFSGLQSGEEEVKINITTNEGQYIAEKYVSVSNTSYFPQLSLNVWAYFDYNFLVKDVKQEVVSDLVNHNTSILIVPSYALPPIGEVTQSKLSALKNYINGTVGKFKYYALYLGGFQDRPNNFMSPDWQKNFLSWYVAVTKVLKQENIPSQNILLYPFDEPKNNNITKLERLYDYCRNNGIKNYFFATLSNPGSERIAQKAEIVQVHSDIPNLLNNVLKYKRKETKIWIYETKFSSGKNILPTRYINMGMKASLYNAEGIGIWSYADVKQRKTNDLPGKRGTWELDNNFYSHDYSLIYRQNATIYPSLRWEALSFGAQEYFWMNLYYKKNGNTKKNGMVRNILNGKLSPQEWETIKLSLVN